MMSGSARLSGGVSAESTRLLAAGTMAVMAIALVSCESAPRSQVAESVATERGSLEPKEATSDLAALAERDVEAFLRHRREASEQSEASTTPEPDIVWNKPAVGEPRSARRPAAESKEGQPALAREREGLDPVKETAPEVVQSSSESMIETLKLRELIVALSKELYQEASYADMPLRELLLIAATTLVSPDRALVPDAIPGLTARERELLGHFQSFFVELGTGLDGSRGADDVIVTAIESLRDSLRTEPRLALGAFALCTRVGGFGDYTPFPRNSFLAHAEQQAIVYIEIEGFTSELNSKGEWVTELSQQLTMYSDRDGIPVWREDWQSAVDVTRNKRNDFFVVQIITLPKALSVGRYHLKVRVRDEKSKAEAEGSVPFEVVADPRMVR